MKEGLKPWDTPVRTPIQAMTEVKRWNALYKCRHFIYMRET